MDNWFDKDVTLPEPDLRLAEDLPLEVAGTTGIMEITGDKPDTWGSVPYRLYVESESFRITEDSDWPNLEYVRGAAGTTPSAHDANTAVNHVLDIAGLTDLALQTGGHIIGYESEAGEAPSDEVGASGDWAIDFNGDPVPVFMGPKHPDTGWAGVTQTVDLGYDDNEVWNTFANLTKVDVGLGNVDNTSDVSKPISAATQTALDAKQPLDSDLTAIAGATPSDNDVMQRKSGSWINRTLSQLQADLQTLASWVFSQLVTFSTGLKTGSGNSSVFAIAIGDTTLGFTRTALNTLQLKAGGGAFTNAVMQWSASGVSSFMLHTFSRTIAMTGALRYETVKNSVNGALSADITTLNQNTFNLSDGSGNPMASPSVTPCLLELNDGVQGREIVLCTAYSVATGIATIGQRGCCGTTAKTWVGDEFSTYITHPSDNILLPQTYFKMGIDNFNPASGDIVVWLGPALGTQNGLTQPTNGTLFLVGVTSGTPTESAGVVVKDWASGSQYTKRLDAQSSSVLVQSDQNENKYTELASSAKVRGSNTRFFKSGTDHPEGNQTVQEPATYIETDTGQVFVHAVGGNTNTGWEHVNERNVEIADQDSTLPSGYHLSVALKDLATTRVVDLPPDPFDGQKITLFHPFLSGGTGAAFGKSWDVDLNGNVTDDASASTIRFEGSGSIDLKYLASIDRWVITNYWGGGISWF